jgi:hypothetical protein
VLAALVYLTSLASGSSVDLGRETTRIVAASPPGAVLQMAAVSAR